jgi:TM2 domain-containing membrane protein YozV
LPHKRYNSFGVTRSRFSHSLSAGRSNHYEEETMADQIPGAEKKVAAGVLAILLGGLGIHKFYLGYTTAGIIMLAVSLCIGAFTCGTGYGLMGLIGLIEGIIYLTKTDADFVATYVTNKKEWF